ncbi:MAG: sodium:proton antiporter NhaD, partial [Crocinitomicaceae bacterium]|nr:sodium:proton antiporter NhaD [Crocinitomicaceae bacterium]
MGIEYIMVIIFIIGYVMIATEHSIHINKAASALLIGMLCWGLYAVWPSQHLKVDTSKSVHELAHDPSLAEKNPSLNAYLHEVTHEYDKEVALDPAAYAGKETIPASETASYMTHYVEHGLAHHLFDLAGILLFLLGAMTIVELMDAHGAFEVITSRISSTNKVTLLWVIGIVTFFLSSALDNLTTAIVMISVIRKLIDDKETKWIFGGFIIIAANAGGAWSPIGDVTTTMLWNNGQLPDSLSLMKNVFLPSIVSLVIPLVMATFLLRGQVTRPAKFEGR